MSQLDPGRSLDALVGVEVMHLRKALTSTPKSKWYLILDHFSTDICAGWNVVEELRRMGWGYKCLRHSEGSTDEGSQVEWAFMKPGQDSRSVSWGRSQRDPHAICLAALKAVGAL